MRVAATGKVRLMQSLLQTVVLTLAMAGVNVGGTICLKLSNGPDKQLFFAGGIVAYVVGAALYMALLKNNDLVVLSVTSSILQMGLVASLGIWMGETVSVVQGAALLVALTGAAIAMLVPVL